MNDVLRGLMNRKSTRAFTGQHLSEADKRLILEAAFAAPTAGCQQLYTVIDVTDPAIKEKLVDTCDHQPFIAQAEMVLVFVADCRKWYRAFEAAGCSPRKPSVGDLLLAVSDANIAAQNAVTAAESLGIGSCYIGDVMENCEEQRALLKLPKYVFPAAMLVFGYPTQQQAEREKPRRAAADIIVHQNGYRELAENELMLLAAQKVGDKPVLEWMKAFCNRKYNSDFSREMSRSVAQYLCDFEEDEP